jgi:hypothetical protein
MCGKGLVVDVPLWSSVASACVRRGGELRDVAMMPRPDGGSGGTRDARAREAIAALHRERERIQREFSRGAMSIGDAVEAIREIDRLLEELGERS